MILAIDIGNTNIVFGCIDRERTYFIERVSTVRTKTELEYAIDLRAAMDIHGICAGDIEGGIICSVVPQVTNVMRLATEKILSKQVLTVGPGIKTGLNIMMDNPSSVGSDLVAGAVAGINEYPLPLAIVDMGTATTVCVIDEKRNYIGGMILPGVMVSLDSLTARASQLQGIGLDSPKNIIGKNTIDCMKSGIIYGSASMIDGLADRLEAELGQKLTVVATGGLSKVIIPYCLRDITIDEDLLLKGLQIIYYKNRT